MLKLFLNKGDVFRFLSYLPGLRTRGHKRKMFPSTLLTKTSTTILVALLIHQCATELIECKFAEDTDICVFNHDIDYNHVYDFRPQPHTTVNNITKISFLRPVPLDSDELMHRLCDIFYNLHEVFVNGTTMYCDVYLYHMPKETTTTREALVEDVAGLHNELLEEVVRKGTAKGSDELRQKMDLVVATVGTLILVCLVGGVVLLVRYIKKRRQDRFWRRSRLYSSRYGHNI